jgi:translation initiation factor IF-3
MGRVPGKVRALLPERRLAAKTTPNTHHDRRAPRADGPRINHGIRVASVRLLDADGIPIGVLPTREALALAQEKGLDLVEVAPMAQPPVCRILDYGKHRYEEAKRKRHTKQGPRRAEVKRLQLTYGAEAYHLGFRIKDATRILTEGYRLQVTLILWGAQRKYPEVGHAQMARLLEGVSAVGVVEQPPTLEGRRLTMRLAPK